MKLSASIPLLIFVLYKTYPISQGREREEVRVQDISEPTYLNTGPDVKRPSDFNKAMNSTSFKGSLLRFLSIEWKSEYASILKTITLHFKIDGICYKYSVSDDVMEVTEIDRFSSPNNDEILAR